MILITAASTAPAYKAKAEFASDQVLLGDYTDLPGIMVSQGKMIRLPDPSGTAYIHEMLALCLDKNISVILPLRTSELTLLAEARQLFDEYGIEIKQPHD